VYAVDEAGSSKNFGLLVAMSLQILISPFGSLLDDGMGSRLVLCYARI